MQGGWSQKAFLRSVVLSRTYRLSSANEAAAMKLDPENKLYWRMNSQRLDAEALRDFLLAISGELTRDSGGPALTVAWDLGGTKLTSITAADHVWSAVAA